MSENNNNSKEFKSPFLLTDDEIAKKGIKEHNYEIFRRKHYQQQFAISTWYNKGDLASHTFRTESFPLTWEQAHAIMRTHNKKQLPEDEKVLKGLEQQIQEIIEKHFKTLGCFLKLDTRSGKDVPVYDFENEETRQLILKELQSMRAKDSNSISKAIVIGTNKFLHLTSASRAIYTLIRSARISEDLAKVTQFGEENFSTHVVLREWCEEMADHPGHEFRSFVYKNQLNAITQYFDFVYFPEVEAHKEILCQRMQELHNSVKEHLAEHEHYVIDFFVGKDKVYIIELNPFHIGAGASLFSWKTDRDIFVGAKPFEFRIVDKKKTQSPNWDPLDPVPLQWRRFVEAEFSKKGNSCCLQ